MRSALRPFAGFFPKLSPHERCIAEAQISAVAPELTHADWLLVQDDAQEAAEPWVVYRPKRRKPPPGTPTSTSTGTGRVELPEWQADPLKMVPASEYLPALTGEPVSSSGRTRCPMPDHEDVHPSAKCYGTQWKCFACGGGNSIIDAASALSGIPPTGADWWRLRDWILDALEPGARKEDG